MPFVTSLRCTYPSSTPSIPSIPSIPSPPSPPALARRWLAAARRWLLVAALAAAGPQAAALENPIAGVPFEPQVQLAGQTLQLNGTGLRAVAWFKGYAAALYLAQSAGSAEAALAQAGAKRLQLRLLTDVPVAEFIKAFHKGVERNTPAASHSALSERMARFDGLLQPLATVHKGDLVNLDWLPGQGMVFWHNGRQLGAAIPGDDFYAALLRVFLGEHPVDAALKAGLLGQRG